GEKARGRGPMRFANADVLVDIGKRGQALRHELLARDFEHRLEDARIGHIVDANLAIHHGLPLAGEINHPSLETIDIGARANEPAPPKMQDIASRSGRSVIAPR